MFKGKRSFKIPFFFVITGIFILVISVSLFLDLKLVNNNRTVSQYISPLGAAAKSNEADHKTSDKAESLPENINKLHQLWGISVAEINHATSEEVPGKTTYQEIAITQVAPDSLGEKMGLKRGDLVIAIDQNRITSMEDYARILGRTEGNDRAFFYIRRGNHEFQLSIRLHKPKM